MKKKTARPLDDLLSLKKIMRSLPNTCTALSTKLTISDGFPMQKKKILKNSFKTRTISEDFVVKHNVNFYQK